MTRFLASFLTGREKCSFAGSTEGKCSFRVLLGPNNAVRQYYLLFTIYYAETLIVVNTKKQKLYLKLGLTEHYEVPGRFRKLREACRKILRQFSSKSHGGIRSYDQKNKKVHDD